MKNTNTITKIISVFVCIAMLIVYIPFSAIAAGAAQSDSRIVDPNTLDQWKNFFGEQESHSQNVSITTEYAGGVWTDKSVFKPGELPAILTDATYNGHPISVKDKGDNFVVALSAIASNKQINGYSTIPTDTVLVLDLSSSMRYTDDNGGSAVDELVEATNKAISDLLSLNKNNRVAVVVYAGNTNKSFSVANGATTIVLPLDSYTAETRGEYLISANVGNNPNRAIEVAEGVKDSAGNDVENVRFEVATGTYMQDGIYEAMKLLLGADPVVSEGVQKGTARLPIMVLMTDGEPTLANNDYNGNDNRTDLGQTNLSNYDGTTGEYTFRDTIAFMTSLTAAFASKEIASHYGKDLLMYTLPYGNAVLSRPEALSVLNPAQSSSVQNELWEKFLDGDRITVFRTGNRYNYQYTYTSNSAVEGEKLTSEDRMYVDKYFPARNDDEMLNAFEAIVDEIVLQSKYHPTYVESDFNHDGYLTFVDKIGSYMEVSDVSGIVIGNRLFSGAALASKFPANSTESIVAGNVLGEDLLNSVKERLGIEDESVAAALVQDAYDHGQLVYNNENDYEHYIGWFCDADGNYVDFWHIGMTEAQIKEAQAKGATHIIRSYAFLGDTTVVPGVSNTNMMYMSVRLARELGTGETIVSWRIPASLVPTVTYEVEVEVDEDGNIAEVLDVALSEDSAQSPIRLLYDVQLRGDLQDWNIAEKLSDAKGQEYINENGYTFYSNKWTADPEDTTLNTYSHFEPSIQNERYYYTQDTNVLIEVSSGVYELYTGSSKPSGNGYYHEYQVFEKLDNGELRIHAHYEPISEAALALAEQSGSGWYIPKDTIHRYYDYEIADKTSNETGTMNHSDHPFVVKEGEIYYTYSTQGNNGKLTLEPATGLRLTKTLAEGYTSNETFTFALEGHIANAQVVRVDSAGYEIAREPIAANGEIEIAAGETVYVVGLTQGNYTVSEIIPFGADYRVRSVKLNGAVVEGTSADVHLAERTISAVEIMNDKQGYGDLIISKDVDHPFDTIPQAIANKLFTINVELSGGDFANKTFVSSGVERIPSVTTDENGVFTVELYNGEALTVENLPEGTTYTVTETLTAADKGYSVDSDSILSGTISVNGASLGQVINNYVPDASDVTLKVTGTKTVEDESGTFDWTNKSFSFKLESYDPATSTYTQIGENAVVSVNGGSYAFENLTFDTLGTYYYKVSEVIPEASERLEGMSYDATTGRIVIHVTDNDVDGKLEIDVLDYTTGEAIAADGNVITFTKNFINTHTTDATYVEFTVDKKVVDDHNVGISEAGFLFGLYKVEGGVVAATPAYTMRTVGEDGKATFHIPLSKVTEDTYILREIIPAEADKILGMSYDTTEYTVTVKAEAANGDLVPSVSFAKNGNDILEEDLVFTNELVLTTDKVELSVNKILRGDRFTGTEEFRFYITETDGSFVKAKAGGVSEEITITNTGTNTFGEIQYTKVGTYYYVVLEKAGSRSGMDYDKAVYHITVNVTAEGTALKAATVINKVGHGVVSSIDFVNTYTISGSTSVTLGGSKNLLGRPMIAGEFHFRLEQVADENGTAMAGGLVLESENGVATNNTAKFTFAPVVYTQTGEYYYRITEISGVSGNGITYSNAEYIVKVVVSDNTTGGLNSQWSVVSGEEIVFNNTYDPNDAYVNIVANKNLADKDLEADQFAFELVETESDFATVIAGGENRTESNDIHGVINFGRIDYNAPGKYYYVVREIIPAGSDAEPGIVYDETEYRITVSVEDNHRGSLVATTVTQMVLVNGHVTIIPTSSIAFNNAYVITGSAELEITGGKTLTGNKALADDMFSFELYRTDDTYATEGVVPETTKNKNGAYSFKIEYTPDDVGETFYYVVKEANAGETIKGITYSAAEYRIKVEVKDNEKGGIETVVTAEGLTSEVNANKTTVSGADFENSYLASSVKYAPAATKNYGGKMKNFTFTLVGEGFETQVKENHDDGEIFFDELEFIATGEYEFTIHEERNILWDFVNWDTNEYTLKIKVGDDGEGKLYIESVTVASVKGRDDLVFENGYIRADGTLELTVEKTLSGDRTDPEGFEFGLYNDGEESPFDTVISDEDGVVSFGTITYTEPGTHTYYVKEILPVVDGEKVTEKDGVIYDTTVYTVVVTVEDNHEGELVVAYKVDGEDVDEDSYVFVFNNEYKTPETTEPAPETTEPTPETTEPAHGMTEPAPDTTVHDPKIVAPQTSDISNIQLWVAMLFLSGSGIVATTVYSKKKEEAEEA